MNKKYPYAPEFASLERKAKICRLESVRLTRKNLFWLGIAHDLAARASKMPRGAVCRTLKLPGANGESFTAQLYAAENARENEPCLIYYPGGGFINGANGGVRRNACLYAMGAHVKVLLVNYRLAPKNPYPIPMEDCYAALAFANEHARTFGADPTRIGVAGDSAGAFFAALCCQMARDRAAFPLPRFQMLLYPVTDRTFSSDTMRDFADAPTWNAQLTRQVWDLYLQGKTGDYLDLFSSGDLRNLPCCYLETAEFDCLRGEGERYGEELRHAGIEVDFTRIAGAVHGFDWVYQSAITQKAIARRIEYMKEHFRN